MNQDPYLLYTGKLQYSGPCLITLAPDGRSVAIAQDCNLYVCNAAGQDEECIESVHSGIKLHLYLSTSSAVLNKQYTHADVILQFCFTNVQSYK